MVGLHFSHINLLKYKSRSYDNLGLDGLVYVFHPGLVHHSRLLEVSLNMNLVRLLDNLVRPASVGLCLYQRLLKHDNNAFQTHALYHHLLWPHKLPSAITLIIDRWVAELSLVHEGPLLRDQIVQIESDLNVISKPLQLIAAHSLNVVIWTIQATELREASLINEVPKSVPLKLKQIELHCLYLFSR